MVCLLVDNAPQRSATCRILSLSEDPQLGPLRATVLRHAGFNVTHPQGKEAIQRSLEQEPFDLLVLGHSLAVEHTRDYVSKFREKNPRGKVLAVAQTELLPIRADRVIRAIDGPEVLIAVIQELLPGTGDPTGKD